MADIMIMELALLILLVIVCVYATYTDITQGMIYNHILIPLFVSAIVLDIIYYCKLFPAGLQVFLFNEVVVIGFSVILYALHIWAAGDSKLLILVSLLIPARMTLLGERSYPEILIIAFAFASSFVFLIYDSLCMWKKRGLNKEKVWMAFRQYIVRLVISCIYITTLCKAENVIFPKIGINNLIVPLVLNISILLILAGIKAVWSRKVCVLGLLLSVGYSIVTGNWFMNKSRIIYYLATAIVMLLQLIINEFNYDSIPVENIRKGMILSRGSVMVLSLSKVKGLPTHTTEDLRSRLTEDEAVAVKRWGKTKGSSGSIQVVRKMPFAIFITIGVAAYFTMIIWL